MARLAVSQPPHPAPSIPHDPGGSAGSHFPSPPKLLLLSPPLIGWGRGGDFHVSKLFVEQTPGRRDLGQPLQHRHTLICKPGDHTQVSGQGAGCFAWKLTMKDCLKETWEGLSSRECPAVSAWTFLLLS